MRKSGLAGSLLSGALAAILAVSLALAGCSPPEARDSLAADNREPSDRWNNSRGPDTGQDTGAGTDSSTGAGAEGDTGADADPGTAPDDPAGQAAGTDQALLHDWIIVSGSDDLQVLKLDSLEVYTAGLTFFDDGTARLIISSRGDLIVSDPYLTWQADDGRFVILRNGTVVLADGSANPLQGTYSISGSELTLTLDAGPKVVLVTLAQWQKDNP